MKQSFSLLVFFMLFSMVGDAQHVLDFTHEEVDRNINILDFNVEADYFSDKIENSLVSNFLFGGTIDRESLMSMSSEMDDDNIFGGWANSGIRYRALSGNGLKFKKPTSLFLDFGMNGYGYTKFTRDAFHLSFLGNADRLGETLSLSDMKSEAMLYQYAGLGIMNESTGSYLSFNLINVQSYFTAETDRFEIYTAADASEIDVLYDGEVVLNDSLRGDFLSNSGTGVTLNGRYNVQLGENKNLLSIELKNAGISSLNNRTRELSADSSFIFNGVNIDDLLSNDNPLNSISLEDSLSVLEEAKDKVVQMPADLRLSYFYRLNENDHLSISARQRFFVESNLELEADYIHTESERVSFNLGAGYGGYGGFRIKAGAFVNVSNWKFHLTTRNLVGAMLTSAKGRSVSFGISRTFRTEEE